jgi:hypothetical protein
MMIVVSQYGIVFTSLMTAITSASGRPAPMATRIA